VVIVLFSVSDDWVTSFLCSMGWMGRLYSLLAALAAALSTVQVRAKGVQAPKSFPCTRSVDMNTCVDTTVCKGGELFTEEAYVDWLQEGKLLVSVYQDRCINFRDYMCMCVFACMCVCVCACVRVCVCVVTVTIVRAVRLVLEIAFSNLVCLLILCLTVAHPV